MTAIHKAFIDVQESGTEAAAATAVVALRSAAIIPADPIIFRADDPFLS
jgi:serpin B